MSATARQPCGKGNPKIAGFSRAYGMMGGSLSLTGPPMLLLPAEERRRRFHGLLLFLGAVCLGWICLASLFLVPPLYGPNPLRAYTEMLMGAALALPAAAVYLGATRLLDRFDPEPWYALVGALLYGGIAACGFSALINTFIGSVASSIAGEETGTFVSTVISAPIVEELWKGMGVLGIAYFLKREFDGAVDGVVFSSFIGLGFAAVENVVYYAQAAADGTESLAATFFVRSVLSPWVHPLYTSMFGLGLGIAREADNPIVRRVSPALGYVLGVLLHTIWNTSASVDDGKLFIALLPLWLIFVLLFVVTVVVLVFRRGHIMRMYLQDEVALGTIQEEEMRLACTPFGYWRARLMYGRAGGELIRTIARLALSKWHMTRAMRGNRHSLSAAFVGPLRARIQHLRKMRVGEQIQHPESLRPRKRSIETYALLASTVEESLHHSSDDHAPERDSHRTSRDALHRASKQLGSDHRASENLGSEHRATENLASGTSTPKTPHP